MLSAKFDELKSEGLFIRSSPDFYKTDWIGDSDQDAHLTTDRGAFATILQNPDTLAKYYITRQTNSSSTKKLAFKLTITTSMGEFQVPQTATGLEFHGRQSHVVVTDYSFGASSKVLYSTASVFFAGKIGGRDVLFLHGSSVQSHEAAIWLRGASGIASKHPSVVFNPSVNPNPMLISFLPGVNGLIPIWDSPDQLVLFADTATSGTFFSPVLPGPDDFSNHWQFGSNATVLVGGPYLVRNATLDDGVLALHGDITGDTRLTVIAPNNISRITWNGEMVENLHSEDNRIFVGSIRYRLTTSILSSMSISAWKYADGLPEISEDYSDEHWVTANKKKTNIPAKPLYGDGVVLYGCDYEL